MDTSIPARGLHGEAYRGHIFWDELFVLPFYVTRFPEINESAILYRYFRLDVARDRAKQFGCYGYYKIPLFHQLSKQNFV